MKSVLKFHWADLQSLFSHASVLLIMAAACIIPAFYAWFNIYSNWDPYGATGNIPIAVCSLDQGYDAGEDGAKVDLGREIVDELTASGSIDWVEVDSAADLEKQVRSGRYYAGLVLGEHLSRNMYDLTAALADTEPEVVFYQNAKTNAVADKITETVAQEVEHSIQNKYLNVLVEKGFAEVEDLLSEAGADDLRQSLELTLTDLRDGLSEYAGVARALAEGAGRFSQDLTGAGDSLPELSGPDLTAAAQLTDSLENAVLPQTEEIASALADLRRQLDTAAASGSLTEEVRDGLLTQTDSLSLRLQALAELLPERGLVSGAVSRALTRLQQKLDGFRALVTAVDVPGGDISRLLDEGGDLLDEMEQLLNGSLLPGLQQFIADAGRDIDLLQRILDSLAAGGQELQPALAAAASALDTLDGSTGQLASLLETSSEGIDQLLGDLEQSQGRELADSLISLLHGDPGEFADFLTSPVEVSSTTVYPVDYYGSAMAPFYSTLAIWVGCVILVAVLRLEGRHTRLPDVSEQQRLWGRFLLFFWLSQIQAAVITLGDVYLLHVQCLYPLRFWFCGAVTSLVFMTLIYGVVLAFGDLGKAAVVVAMIVQIAGSGGTFPIEILPGIFSSIYRFFPYPYAINAMREAMFGLYGNNMYVYLAELLVFAAIGLLAWLGLRRPNAGVLRFMEEELDETGVL